MLAQVFGDSLFCYDRRPSTFFVQTGAAAILQEKRNDEHFQKINFNGSFLCHAPFGQASEDSLVLISFPLCDCHPNPIRLLRLAFSSLNTKLVGLVKPEKPYVVEVGACQLLIVGCCLAACGLFAGCLRVVCG